MPNLIAIIRAYEKLSKLVVSDLTVLNQFSTILYSENQYSQSVSLRGLSTRMSDLR